jgi:hypothetical protein
MLRMRNLAIALSMGFLGLAQAGCESSNGGTGTITLTWSLQDQQSGLPLNCVTGEVVEVTAGGITDQFNCTDGGGVTGPIPVGTYNVTFDLVLNNQVESTATMSGVPVLNRSTTDVGHILFVVATTAQPGTLDVTWEIRVGSVGGPTGTCAAGETVTFDFGGGLTFAGLDCTTYAATLTQIPAGNYSGITASLYMSTTLESMGTLPTVTIPPGGAGTPQHVIFVVAAKHR